MGAIFEEMEKIMSQNYKDLKPLTAIDVEWSRPVYEGDYMTVEIDGELYARYEYEYGMDIEFTVELPELHQGERVVFTHFDDMGYLILTGEKTAQNIPAPALYEQEINFEGTEVTGKADYNPELEDKVVILNDQGEVIGEAEIQEDGSFTVELTETLEPQDHYTIELSNKFVTEQHAQIVPNTVEANDDEATVEVDIKPAITESSDSVYGKPLLADVLGIKQHLLGKQPVLNFEVEDGHTLDANFKAWAGSKIALFDHVKLNLQFKNDHGQWETITKSSNYGLFSKIWFFGERAEIQVKDFPPGEYRVVASSSSLVSLLPAIKLEGNYTDYDHSKIGDVSLGVVKGNVFEGDFVTKEELTSVVAVNGKAVGEKGLTLYGEHGTLQIKADGSYSYVSNGKASSLGKTDVFEYTITDGRTTSSANLEIQTVAPELGDVIAKDEAVKAEVQFGYVEDAPELVGSNVFNTKGGGLFKKPSGATSFKYVVDENTTSDVTISAMLPKWDSGTDFVIRVMQGDKVVALESGSTSNFTHIHGNQFVVQVPGLEAGEYRIEVETSRNTWSSNYKVQVDVVETVTHLDQYELSNVTASETANIFDNDVTGVMVKWEVFDGENFIEVTDTQTITGQYGELTISKNGDYTYKPFNDLAHTTEDLVDDFSYRLHGGNGEISEATIKAVVEVSGAGIASSKAALFDMLDELESFDLLDDNAIDLSETTFAANDQFEGVNGVALALDELVLMENSKEVELPASLVAQEANNSVGAAESVETYDVQPTNDLLNELLDEQAHYMM